MLITFERKVPQSSYTSQNDHKSKGFAFKIPKAALVVQFRSRRQLRGYILQIFSRLYVISME